jgi:uncharacterized protein YjbJ (UPF0337 family)
MDNDRIKGKAKEIEGRVQIVKGKLNDSKLDKVEGTIKKVEGEIQHLFGKAKDAVRKADKEI